MTISINNNYSAALALQNLNKTADALQITQNRISSGQKVTTAKDNSAVYAIAEISKGELTAQRTIIDVVNQGRSLLSVTLDAGKQVTDVLNQLLAKATAATSSTLTTAQRGALQNDYDALASAIDTIVNNATFNGANLIGTAATGVSVTTDVSGKTLAIAEAKLDKTALGLAALKLDTAAASGTAASKLRDAIAETAISLGTFGSKASTLDTVAKYTKVLIDANANAISNLVDADLAEESATLQALQVKQQLGTQALSIANNAPQSILSLFR